MSPPALAILASVLVTLRDADAARDPYRAAPLSTDEYLDLMRAIASHARARILAAHTARRASYG